MRRRLGAIATYKAARRAIQRARRDVTVKPLAKPAGYVLRGTDGLWRVWAPPIPGPPFKPAEFLSGPYDTRDEADAWISDQKTR